MRNSRDSSASISGKAAALCALCLASLLPSTLVAQGKTEVELLGKATCDELAAKGRVVNLAAGADLSLLPAHASAEGIRSALAAEKPSLVVEAVFALPRKEASDPAGRRSELASIYGLMRSFGSLQGIEYYSASRKAMRVLYVESYRIDDEKNRAPLPDEAPPRPDAIPASETLLAFQKDMSLGSNVYRYSFTTFSDALLIQTTNLTRMSYSLVPMLGPEEFKTRILVVAADDAIVFYMASGADAPGFVKAKLRESLANRAEALFRWFSAKSASFLKPE